MNKLIMAATALAGLLSAPALAATVYEAEGKKLNLGGRLEARGMFNGDTSGNEIKGTMKDASRARIHVEGETTIPDAPEQLTAFTRVEYETKDGSDHLENREMYLGFKFSDTAISYGRQDTANVQISDMTDIASAHSGQQQGLEATSSNQSNTFLVSSDYNDVTLQASYQVSSEEDKDALGLSALWQSDTGLELGASHTAAGDKGSAGGDIADAKQTTLGVGYTRDNLYLAATYATGDITNTIEFDSLELAAQYKVNDAFRVIGIYGTAELDNGSTSVDIIDFFALEGQYRFNESLRAYASYKLNGLKNTSTTEVKNGEDSLMLGLRYNF